MKLEYSVGIEDVVNFNISHVESTPQVRRKLAIMRFVWAFAPLIALFLIMNVEGASSDRIYTVITLVTICVSAPIYLFQPAFFRWSTARQIRKLYGRNENKALLGDHQMEIVGKQLIDRLGDSEIKLSLNDVNRVLSTDDYTFVYTKNSQVHILPQKGVSSGSYDEFVAAIRKKSGCQDNG